MSEKVIVTVNEGKVRGFKTKSTYSGVEYYSFLGIPYGQTTVGKARFKDPVKVKPWNSVLDTTTEKDGCLQYWIMRSAEVTGSEDCLYNNIHTTAIPSKGDSLKPVIVNIHPGGQFAGSPDPSHYGSPDYFIHKDVVYVCIGYRLHILGFLNLHMKNCSGNQGLKDLILGFKWIRDNISVFGGDPDNITVMGSSSGAAMVHLLLLSPLAKGLFHKAIIMGMYVFNPVIVGLDENAQVAFQIAEKLRYDGPSDDYRKLLTYYKNTVNMEEFLQTRVEHFFSQSTLQVYLTSPFSCTTEAGENSPLPLSLEKLIPTTNRIPLMIGFCDNEACMTFALHRITKTSITDYLYKGMKLNERGWAADLNDDDMKLLQKEVEDFYLNGKSVETASQSVLCEIITDAALSDVYDSLINVISADLPSSVYVYNFHYDGGLCAMKTNCSKRMEKALKGTYHSADYSHWNYFKVFAGNVSRIQTKDREMIEKFTNLVISFAKTSNPNHEGIGVEWKPTTPDHPSYLVIDETLENKEQLLNGTRMEFWHRLKRKFNKNGYTQ